MATLLQDHAVHVIRDKLHRFDGHGTRTHYAAHGKYGHRKLALPEFLILLHGQRNCPVVFEARLHGAGHRISASVLVDSHAIRRISQMANDPTEISVFAPGHQKLGKVAQLIEHELGHAGVGLRRQQHRRPWRYAGNRGLRHHQFFDGFAVPGGQRICDPHTDVVADDGVVRDSELIH